MDRKEYLLIKLQKAQNEVHYLELELRKINVNVDDHIYKVCVNIKNKEHETKNLQILKSKLYKRLLTNPEQN